MSAELITGNVVITAEQFNPSILRESWLVRNGIVREDEFGPGCLFAESVAQVTVPEFDLLVVPPRAQFVAKVPRDREQQVILAKLGEIVRLLPETPYRAIGFNLIWHVTPEGKTLEDLSRSFFFLPSGPVHRSFDSPDARFGAYLSKESMGFRLKLTALPTLVESPGKAPEHLIVFSFNYHLDLKDVNDPAKRIIDVLAKWDDAVKESTSIIDALGVPS